jgi:hypothetical protein
MQIHILQDYLEEVTQEVYFLFLLNILIFHHQNLQVYQNSYHFHRRHHQ